MLVAASKSMSGLQFGAKSENARSRFTAVGVGFGGDRGRPKTYA